jgi:tetratricopeptide (TPR) repeat protein
VLVRGQREGYFDVLHLTGHATHRPEGPRFLTESETGYPEWVSAADIARAIPRRPPLTFLSGSRTGQSLAAGAVASLAENLLGRGFPAVLGWGQPVFETDATVAAAALYESLAAGFSPVRAVLDAHAAMLRANARHWHLLRLFVAGAAPGPPVTEPKKVRRKPAPPATNQKRFLGKAHNVAEQVVDRKDFVGRRRPLQRFVRALRGTDHPAGAVVYGLGGVGKSSLACRLCDRLEEFDPVVHVGKLNEPSLLRALEELSSNATERAHLQSSREALKYRMRAFLEARRDAGRKNVLLVLDDFEQNTPLLDGRPLIDPTAQEVLEALVRAVEQTGAARCLITSRYRLTTSQSTLFYQEELNAMPPAEADKKRRSLSGYQKAEEALRQQADRVADGNPRLMERLNLVLASPGLDHASLLQQVEAAAAEFREQILAKTLLSGLPDRTRQVMAAALLYQLPVPMEAVTALFPDRPAEEVRSGLAVAAAVGLVEEELAPEGVTIRVPRLLEPLLEAGRPPDQNAFAVAAAETLSRLWWECDYQLSELQSLELLRLAVLAKRGDIAAPVADAIGGSWTDAHRYREAHALYQGTIETIGRDYRLLGGLGRVSAMLGGGDGAHQMLSEALRSCPVDYAEKRAFLGYYYADLLRQRGELEEALHILQDELVPVYERLGDVRSRAVTLGQVADILQARGQLDEALRIRREEELPVYERLGDVRSRAVTLSEVADILAARGELDEALRVWREEVLPPIRRLQDLASLTGLLMRLGFYSTKKGNTDDARICLQEARDCATRLGNEKTLKAIEQLLAAIPTGDASKSASDSLPQ